MDDAVKAAESLGGNVWVVRPRFTPVAVAKNGGVKVGKSLEQQVREYARSSACNS